MTVHHAPDRQVGESLKLIEGSVEPLNKASDRLSQVLGEVEEAVRKLKTGVEVTLWSEPIFEAPQGGFSLCVGFGKVDGRYGLFVVGATEDQSPDEYKYVALPEMSRDYKMEVVERLEHLVAAVADATKDKVKEVNDAADVARLILNQLDAGKVKKK